MLDLTFETPKIKTIAGAKHDWELVHRYGSARASRFELQIVLCCLDKIRRRAQFQCRFR